MVPRRIHQFWHSGDPPASALRLISTWKSNNPEYEHIIWSDKAAEKMLGDHLGDEATDLYRACQFPAMRADVLRVAALYFFGGIYADVDEYCVKPLDPLLDTVDQVLLYRITSKGPDGSFTWRARNDCMIAAPHAPFFGRLLSTILANIKGKISDNLWLVTGPGAVTSVARQIRDLNRSGIRIIESVEMFQFSRPNYGLDFNEGTTHWSEQQKHKEIILLDPASDCTYRWADLVFLGSPGSGATTLLGRTRDLGLDVGQGRLRRDGIVSWWHVGFAREAMGQVHFKSKAADGFDIVLAGRIVHYLRDPRAAIPDLLEENEANGRQNNSFLLQRAVLRRLYNIDIASMDALTAATTAYALWNRHAEHLATLGPIKVEEPLSRDLFADPSGLELPDSQQDRAHELCAGPFLDSQAIIHATAEIALPHMKKYLDFYTDVD